MAALKIQDAVDFSSAHFSAALDLSGSEFADKSVVAINFNGMAIDGILDLSDITVDGGAVYYHLSVAAESLNSASDKLGIRSVR